MPIKTTWILPGKLIHLQLFDFVSRDDVYTLTRQVETLISESRTPPVHVLVDYTAATYIPTNLGFLTQAARSIKPSSKLGYAVVLGNRFPLMTTIAQLVCQMVGVSVHIIHSFEEAQEYLQTVDPDLNSSPGPDDAGPDKD